MIENRPRYCATIGFFDGVHRGHRQVIKRLQELAYSKGLESLVITFDNHPLEVICPTYVPDLLLSSEEKVQRILETGISKVEVMHFTKEMMNQLAFDFMKHELKERLGIEVLIIGYDNRFGKKNDKESFETYVEYGKELGIEVIEGPRPEECGLFEGKAISSSLIRSLRNEGRIHEALQLMENDKL